jgi:hypothetical protein
MNRIIISALIALTAFNYSGIASFIYLIMLLSGFVDTNYASLSSFTALSIYFMHGLFGLFSLMASVILTMVSGIMFWFDMSLQDVQKKAIELNKHDAGTKNAGTKNAGTKNEDTKNAEAEIEIGPYMLSSFLLKMGIDVESFDTVKNTWFERYRAISNAFDNVTDIMYTGIQQFRALTIDVALFTHVYGAYDYMYDIMYSFINSVDTLKQMSSMSRDSMTQPNRFDLPLPQFGNMGKNKKASKNTNNQPFPGLGGMGGLGGLGGLSGLGGLGGLGGFDMKQMQEMENSMTPKQKEQAEQAARDMLGNFDLSQMGDMMSMFGMHPPPNSNSTKTTSNKKKK